MLLDRRNQKTNEVGILDMFLKARDNSYEDKNGLEDFFGV